MVVNWYWTLVSTYMDEAFVRARGFYRRRCVTAQLYGVGGGGDLLPE